MTTQPPDNLSDAATETSIVDPESLRDRADVPVHEDADVVDEKTFEAVDDLDDMAVTGVTNDDGEVLMMRVTEDCDLKPPSASVAPDEDFAAAARQWVREQAGLTVDVDALEAAWHFEARLEDEDRTAERYFLVYSASPAPGETSAVDPSADAHPEDGAEYVGWFDEAPDDAAETPGMHLFFE